MADPRMRAVFLSDALATGIGDEVAHALHLLCQKGCVAHGFVGKGADELTLVEIMEILQAAGVQLVAIRRPDA
ncbi:hypothetical protein [Roseovarius sp. MMSF_3281]|uniref:hypothetical protein n=1 Tax=Roseovarius sp. MMSF_3281 TaxID=3046694 RepID=UPI00273D273E|nr:hypothetical protein [Roseovarius sp. MMSF_3281]